MTFVQHFHLYLLGHEFLLDTDHGSLTWLTNFKGQLAQLLEYLQEFSFKIAHRPSRKHTNADALLRHPSSQCGQEELQPSQEPIVSNSLVSLLIERSHQDLCKFQLDDPVTGVVLHALERNQQPEPNVNARGGLKIRCLMQIWDHLLLEDGLLKRKYDNTKGSNYWSQMIVPHVSREEIMQELHAGSLEGRLGEDKTVGKIKQHFYWPGMQQVIVQWIRTCSACATRKSPSQHSRALLQTVTSGFPMHIVAVDFLGPLPQSTAGNSYILVASDYFTKWMKAYAIPNQKAITVARKLVDQMFCHFSPPEQLHFDQGKQFESAVMQEVYSLLGIKKSRTSLYHPQYDCLVERNNCTLLDMIATTSWGHPFH